MTTERFCEAMLQLHDRAARLSGGRGTKLRDLIADAVAPMTPGLDARLTTLYRQLTLAEITRRVTRAECQIMTVLP